MASEVFFANRRVTGKSDSLVERLRKMLARAELETTVKENALIAVKFHFGDLGITTSVRPVFIRTIVEEVMALRGKPFLVDTNTLYRGSRSNAYDHLVTAHKNGFGYGTVGAPIVIGDGLRGKAYHKVPIKGVHYREVPIADAIFCADGMIAVAHVTGHPGSGLAGTIKNLGMGCGAPCGKRQQHDTTKPDVTSEKCIGCGTCIKWCPADAILLESQKAKILHGRCIGCGECVVSCPEGAIRIKWDSKASEMQEKMAEFAVGAVKGKGRGCIYVNLILDVTPLCDCPPYSDKPIVPDVGIAVSRDPVALDQASADLVNAQQAVPDCKLEKNTGKGEDKFRGLFPDVDWTIQLVHAERLGLGTREYKLVEM